MTFVVFIRADSRFAPNQWETSLQSNAVSLWLGVKPRIKPVYVYIYRPYNLYYECMNVTRCPIDVTYVSVQFSDPWAGQYKAVTWYEWHGCWHRSGNTTKRDHVIKWKLFPRYWPFVRGIHRSPVNSPHKGQWREALMFSLICAWINRWVNNGEAGDLRRYRACDFTVMGIQYFW